MDMQDKDLDELFRSKLDGLEAEPSANVWPGITSGLDAGKRRKSIAPFLNIAASVLILVTAGIIIIPKTGRVHIRQHADGVTAKTTGKTAATIITSDTSAMQVAVTKDPQKPVNKAGVLAVPDQKTANTATENPADTSAASTAARPGNQTQVAAVPQTPHNTTATVAAANNVPLLVKEVDEPLHTIAAVPVPIATVALPNATQPAATEKPRRKIRRLSDLVNLVVAKVDKRRGDLIDEDGESNIIGVNLGVLKAKKDE